MLKVLNPGLFTTIQDRGRFTHRKIGVPTSGAMDAISAAMANSLLNNDVDAAVMEFTMIGPKLQFNESTHISISGGDFQAKLNNKNVDLNKALFVDKGDILSFSNPIYGHFGYLAVSGGFQTKNVLGSRSFYNGITEKSKLEKGDTIPFLSLSSEKIIRNASFSVEDNYFQEKTIPVYPGPEFDLLSNSFQKKVINSVLEIKPQSNRMAYVLKGLENITAEDIITAPVQPGTVQLTPSGACVVLMKDAQTTGGYARILQLSEKAIGKLAQKKPGSTIQFDLQKI